MTKYNIEQILQGITKSNYRFVGKAISMLEDGRKQMRFTRNNLLAQVIKINSKKSPFVIGFTGSRSGRAHV